MLRNPAYKGSAAFRKTTRVKRIKKTKLALSSKNPLRSELSSTRDRPKEDWIYIPVPVIIKEKIFDFAQQKLKDNIKFAPRNNKKHNYLLSGLLGIMTSRGQIRHASAFFLSFCLLIPQIISRFSIRISTIIRYTFA